MTALGQISSIFQSIQGEGIYVGERQIFLRFIGCNLSCEYCDVVEGASKALTADEVVVEVDKFLKNPKLYHSISLTGGEPLLQVDFLKELLPKLKIKKYLETNGTLPSHLEEIIELVDIVAMDIKLPSATGCASYFKEHEKFLENALFKDLFVKAVFTKDTLPKEIDDMCALIERVESEIPLVLQPVTPKKGSKNKPTPEQIMSFHAIAKNRLKKVLVIPQAHKMMDME